MVERLHDEFLEKIRSGDWPPNRRIPAETELARTHVACRSTIRRAIQQLEQAGLLYAIQGKGRVVSSGPRSGGRMIGLISSGADIAQGAGFRFSQALLQAAEKEGDHFATFAFSAKPGGTAITDRLKAYADLSGAVLLGPAFPSQDIPDLARRLPVVALARDEREAGVPSFLVDYGCHALLAARHLLKNGHRKIVVTHGVKAYFDRVGSNIDQGVEWAFAAEGADLGDVRFIRADLSAQAESGFYDEVEKGSAPTAIISYGTWPVSQFFREARRRGNRDLEAVEAILLNDLEDDTLRSRVSYFRCPYEELAGEAKRVLYDLISGHPVEKRFYPFRGELIQPTNGVDG